LIGRLEDLAQFLGCQPYRDHARELTAQPTGSEPQIAIARETADLAEVVRRLSDRSRLWPWVANEAVPLTPRVVQDQAGAWLAPPVRPPLAPGVSIGP